MQLLHKIHAKCDTSLPNHAWLLERNVLSIARKQQHNQDLKRSYKRQNKFSNSSFFTSENTLHLTRVHCTTFYQSALHHEQADIIPSFRVDSREKFCSDLPVKRCTGDRD